MYTGQYNQASVYTQANEGADNKAENDPNIFGHW